MSHQKIWPSRQMNIVDVVFVVTSLYSTQTAEERFKRGYCPWAVPLVQKAKSCLPPERP